MSAPSIDFPDWNPPRDRVAARPQTVQQGTLPPGFDTFGFLAPELCDNAMFFTVNLPPLTAIYAGPSIAGSSDQRPRGAINLAGDPALVVVPVGWLGENESFQLINASPDSWDYEVDSIGFQGLMSDLLVPSTRVDVVDGLTVPGMDAAAPAENWWAGSYERATVQVHCDVPYTVTVRRSYTADRSGWVIDWFDELVATAASAGDTFADVPIGSDGFAVIVGGTGVTDGTCTVSTRSYRAAGY